MKIKWIKTAHKGLRYYEHPTRRHGKKKDRYYSIRFKVDGIDYTYGIGWWSDGIPDAARQRDANMGFEEYCLSEMKLFKVNVKEGSGARSPKEKRKIAAENMAKDKEEQERRERESLTFETFFKETYLPQAKVDKKERTILREEGLFNAWIYPALGHFPMKNIAPFHLEILKRDMTARGQSPRSIEYALSVVRQIFNTAKRLGAFEGENPTTKVKFPKPDNGRMRFLTHGEANALLEALANKSIDVHHITLLSLHCGLRFGEIASLTWQDVDLEKSILTIRDAKAGSRFAFLTEQTAEMLRNRKQDNPSDFVFPKRGHKKMEKMDRISPTFFRTVNDLKLNEGINDPRLQICFHSCRHSYASWMVEQGQDLYTVQRLLGHKTNVMTQRYAHLSENKLRAAAMALSQALKSDEKLDDQHQIMTIKK